MPPSNKVHAGAPRKNRARGTTKSTGSTRSRVRSKAQGMVAKTLPGAKTGRASAFAPALGDAPVRAYIASLPTKQRAIARRFDRLVAEAIPGIRRCIKWGMAFYGTDAGWFVSCGGFADHVKITFLHGTKLEPVPPVGTGKYTRGVDVTRADELDQSLLVRWLGKAKGLPGLGAGRRASGRRS